MPLYHCWKLLAGLYSHSTQHMLLLQAVQLDVFKTSNTESKILHFPYPEYTGELAPMKHPRLPLKDIFCPEPSFFSHPAVSSVSATGPGTSASMQTANSLHGTQCDSHSPPLSLYLRLSFSFLD